MYNHSMAIEWIKASTIDLKVIIDNESLKELGIDALGCAPLGAPCDVKEATHPRVRY